MLKKSLIWLIVFSIFYTGVEISATSQGSSVFAITKPTGVVEEHTMDSTNKYILYSIWKVNGVKVGKIDYFPSTINDANRLNKVKLYSIYDGNVLKNQIEYNTTGQVIQDFYYFSSGVIQYKVYYEQGIKKNTYEYNSTGKFIKEFIYFKANGKVQYEINFDPTSGTIQFTNEYNSDGKFIKTLHYFPSHYATSAPIQYEKEYSTVSGELLRTYEYNVSRQLIKMLEYYPGVYSPFSGSIKYETFYNATTRVRTKVIQYEYGTAKMINVYNYDATGKYVIPYIVPIDNAIIVCAPGCYSGHAGTDYQNQYNRYGPIYASANGVVVKSEFEGTNGNYIEIDHGNGESTYYGHMKESSPIPVGTRVVQGQYIGDIGQTGYATGPHVHFEVRRWSLGYYKGGSYSSVQCEYLKCS